MYIYFFSLFFSMYISIILGLSNNWSINIASIKPSDMDSITLLKLSLSKIIIIILNNKNKIIYLSLIYGL